MPSSDLERQRAIKVRALPYGLLISGGALLLILGLWALGASQGIAVGVTSVVVLALAIWVGGRVTRRYDREHPQFEGERFGPGEYRY